MTSKTTTKTASIRATSTPNLYYADSSNLFDVYPLMMTAPGACLCGCPAGSKNIGCYHRSTALATLKFIPVEDDTLDELSWRRIQNNIDRETELDLIRDLFGGDAA